MLTISNPFKIAAFTILALLICHFALAETASVPAPKRDAALATSSTEESLVVAGGCFWGIQSVFQHVKGVKQAISGYAGGAEATAFYEQVGSGTTGHAESVKITYDPSQISLGQLLQVFFSVAHNPTMLNYQGPDHGTQYRSAIFYATPEQQGIAESYIAQLNEAKIFASPIVTKLEPLKGFYAAEAYHQDYARLHPDNSYIRIHDAPKVVALQKKFPQLYVTDAEEGK